MKYFKSSVPNERTDITEVAVPVGRRSILRATLHISYYVIIGAWILLTSVPNERTEVSLCICALLLYYFLSTPLSKNGCLHVPKKHHMICRSNEKSPGKGGSLPHHRHFGLTSVLRPKLSESMMLTRLTSNRYVLRLTAYYMQQ